MVVVCCGQSVDNYFPNRDGLFEQDNAPCHMARNFMDWFQEHNTKFQLMSSLPNSNRSHFVYPVTGNSSDLRKHYVEIMLICVVNDRIFGRICLRQFPKSL